MNVFEKFVSLISAGMETPPLYGWWHLLFLVLTVLLTVGISVKYRDADERVVRRILLVAFLVMLVGEIYKQLTFSMSVTDGVASWGYSFYAFPFQLCSTPLYVLPLALLSREGRLHDAAIAYLASFSLFGGLAVMAYPGDVFLSQIGINIQTMLHHGAQVVVGVYLAVRYRGREHRRCFFPAAVLFVVLVLMALSMNVGFRHLFGISLNMFFIGPYEACTLPLVSLIYPLLPYPVFLLLYIVGFSLVAAAMYYGFRALARAIEVRHVSR